jgi:hypothetical protein
MGEEEKRHLHHPIFTPNLLGIKCPCSQSLHNILRDHSRVTWEFLESIKCHWDKYILYDASEESLLLWKPRDTTYLDTHQSKYAKTGTNSQLTYITYPHIVSS